MKLNEVYNLWVVSKTRQVKKSTISAYKMIYANTISPEFGNMDIKNLNKKCVQPIIYRWLDEGRSAKYCNDILIVFRMIMRYASEEMDEDIPDIHWRMVFPTTSKRAFDKVERYTQEEYRKIVNYAIENPSPRNLGILLTICTGMRIGEICALQWKDVDFDTKTIQVNRTIERIYNHDTKMSEIIFSTPKTSSSQRRIPIMREIIPMMKKFCAVSNPEYYVCTCSENFIEPRTYRNYYRSFILDKVKLGHVIKFHGLRHTFATVMIENKVDIKTTSVILGHSDVSTTLNVYVHPSEEAKRSAMNVGLKKLFK